MLRSLYVTLLISIVYISSDYATLWTSCDAENPLTARSNSNSLHPCHTKKATVTIVLFLEHAKLFIQGPNSTTYVDFFEQEKGKDLKIDNFLLIIDKQCLHLTFSRFCYNADCPLSDLGFFTKYEIRLAVSLKKLPQKIVIFSSWLIFIG